MTTYTANGDDAGTAAKVFIKLFGVYGQTNEIQLISDDEQFKEGEWVDKIFTYVNSIRQ